MKLKKQLYRMVEVIIQKRKVYLLNKLDEPINELVYNTFSMLTTEDEIGLSDTPHYQIQDIPAGHAVYLETLDGWEDGSIYYQVTSVKTASITMEDTFTLKQRVLSGLIKLPPIANCSIEKLHSKAGFMINSNDKKAINELYWLAEELKSYTDLTAARFDIENAQRRLFPMQSVIEKIDSFEFQKLYEELTNLLETPMFFDKVTFSEKVDELYKLLESQK